jgi:DNA-directed RNA polymerase beta subunit
VGAKFTSPFGQKGVLGILIAQEDMPFTMDGRQPDYLLHPAAFARMTIGQIHASNLCKILCSETVFPHGTTQQGQQEDHSWCMTHYDNLVKW